MLRCCTMLHCCISSCDIELGIRLLEYYSLSTVLLHLGFAVHSGQQVIHDSVLLQWCLKLIFTSRNDWDIWYHLIMIKILLATSWPDRIVDHFVECSFVHKVQRGRHGSLTQFAVAHSSAQLRGFQTSWNIFREDSHLRRWHPKLLPGERGSQMIHAVSTLGIRPVCPSIGVSEFLYMAGMLKKSFKKLQQLPMWAWTCIRQSPRSWDFPPIQFQLQASGDQNTQIWPQYEEH